MANHFQDKEDWIVVPIFSGENLSVWIAEIEELMIRYEVPMIQWVNFSHVYVRGSARKWVGMHYDEICQMDWSKFLVALRVEFDASSSVEELLVDETVIDSLVEENGFIDILYVGVEQKGCRSGQINFPPPKGSILGIVDQASHREIPGMIPFYYVAASPSSLVDITPSKGNNIAAPARTIVHNIITSSYIMADKVEGYDFSDTNFSWEPGPVLQTPDGLHKSVLAVNHFPNGDTPWALLEELLLLLYDTSTANGDSFILTISLPCRRSIFSQLGICGRCVHSSMIEFQYGGDSTATANKLQCLDIGGFTTMLVTKVECLGEQLFKLGIGLNVSGSAFPDWNAACTVLLVILNIPCAIVGLAHSFLFGTASPGKEVSHIEMLMMFRSCFHLGIVYLTAGDADKMLSVTEISMFTDFVVAFSCLRVNTEVRYLDNYLGLPGHPGMVSGKSQCCRTVIHFASSSIVLCCQRLNMKDEALITKLMHCFGYNDRPATTTYIGYLDSEILRQRKLSVICIFSPNLLHLTSWLLQGRGATNVVLAECEIVFGFLSTVLVFITSYKWSIQIVHISCYVGTEVIVVGQQQHAWVGLATKIFSIICLAGSHIRSQGSGSEGMQGAIHHTSAQSMVILVPSVDKISKIESVLVFYKITHRIIYLKVGCHWINSCLSTCLETNESFAGFSPDSGYGQFYFLWEPGPLPVRWQSAHVGIFFSNVGQNHGNMRYCFQSSMHTQSMVKQHLLQLFSLQDGTSDTISSVIASYGREMRQQQKYGRRSNRIGSLVFCCILGHVAQEIDQSVAATYRLYAESIYVQFFPASIIPSGDLSQDNITVGNHFAVHSSTKVSDEAGETILSVSVSPGPSRDSCPIAKDVVENIVDGSAVRAQSQDTPTPLNVVAAAYMDNISATVGSLNISASEVIHISSLETYIQLNVVRHVLEGEESTRTSPGPKTTSRVHPPGDSCWILVVTEPMVACPSLIFLYVHYVKLTTPLLGRNCMQKELSLISECSKDARSLLIPGDISIGGSVEALLDYIQVTKATHICVLTACSSPIYIEPSSAVGPEIRTATTYMKYCHYIHEVSIRPQCLFI